jgi:hypothetical protein
MVGSSSRKGMASAFGTLQPLDQIDLGPLHLIEELARVGRERFDVAALPFGRSITAAGTPNIWNMHYYRNDGPLQDGDLVLDYAPDYHYYVSDVARMWPVNGKFSPVQRELLGFVLEYRNAILKRIRPGVTADQIMQEAKAAMEPVFQRMKFSTPIYEQAARRLVVDRRRRVFALRRHGGA